MLNYNERIILTEQYFTTGQQPEWTNLINKESGTTYYNVSIVTPTLRMNHILHNRPTINMKAIQCSITQYSVRLLYILFCLAALIYSPHNCHWPSLEVTFAQSGHSPTQDIYTLLSPLTPEWQPTLKSNKAIDTWLMEVLNCLCVYTLGQSNQRLLHWLPWRKNVGSMGSHTSTEQIMQLAVHSELIPGRRQTDKDTPLCINNTLV